MKKIQPINNYVLIKLAVKTEEKTAGGVFIPDTAKEKSKEGEKQHRIVVYTSPTCSWCGAVKSYLKKNHIFFREVDISRDIKAGQDLVRRSGQMGVPQTEIDGRIVVGFDKPKLDAILGTKSR